MDRYCPECHSHMTPSLVGYLCVHCGHVQRFYSNTEATMATPHVQIGVSKTPTTKSVKTESKSATIKDKRQIKTTLKRLMVPELPDPRDHRALQDQHSTQTTQAAPRAKHSAEAITPLATAISASEQAMPETAPNQASSLSKLQASLHPKQDTSLWVLITLAVILLGAAAVLLLLIIFR